MHAVGVYQESTCSHPLPQTSANSTLPPSVALAPRLQARSRAASPPFVLWGAGQRSESRAHVARERARTAESVSSLEEESWAWSEPKERPTRHLRFNTGDIRVCRFLVSCITPPPCTVLYSYHPAVCRRRRRLERRGRLRLLRPPIDRGSSLRDPLPRATTRREANGAVVHTTPAATRLDVVTVLLTVPPPSLHLGKHLTTRRIDDVCLIRKEPLEPWTCQQTACTSPRFPPRYLRIECEDTHEHLKHEQHYPDITQAIAIHLSLDYRTPTVHQRLAISVLFGKQEHALHRPPTIRISPISHRKTASRPVKHTATRHVSIPPPYGTRAVRQERAEELEEELSPWCQVPNSTT